MITKKAFTLIELMTAIIILVILTMISYAPYHFYQNKAKLKVTTKEVSQLLYESRNKAINGSIGSNGNVSIGVYFDTSVLNNNKIKVFSYPHDIDTFDISYIESTDIKLLKVLNLRKGIQVDNIESKDNLLFLFNSISGDLKYYSWSAGNMYTITENNISITFSYKGSTSPGLNKTINYFTNTNIIDY